MVVPGDPIRVMMGQREDPVAREQLEKKLGLDKPAWQRYLIFAGNSLKGDFGRSYVQKREVREIINNSFWKTVHLSVAAMTLAIILGVGAGILSAVKPNTWIDYSSMGLALIGVSMPVFWLGLMLYLVFTVNLGWVEATGTGKAYWITIPWMGKELKLVYWYQNIILPAITLSTVPMAIIARMTRSSMLEVLNLDYVRTARAKGLNFTHIVMRHALKNAMIPIITVVGTNFASLLAGAVLTETVFSWPGLGQEIVFAILQRDFPVVMGGTLLFALNFVLVNLVVDVLYAWVDPRIRQD